MKKPAAVGGPVIPDFSNKWRMDTTVLTLGFNQKTYWWTGIAVAVLHACTWLTAMIMILVWANSELDKISGVTNDSPVKMLGNVYAFFILGILAMVIAHAATARKDDGVYATLTSVMLLTMVAFENTLGCAYLAFSLSTENAQDLYSAVLVSQLIVSLGSAMIVAFYVNWSHRGNAYEGVGGAV